MIVINAPYVMIFRTYTVSYSYILHNSNLYTLIVTNHDIIYSTINYYSYFPPCQHKHYVDLRFWRKVLGFLGFFYFFIFLLLLFATASTLTLC